MEYRHAPYHAFMRTDKAGKVDAAAALDAVTEKLAKRVAPKLARLRAAEGSVRELREDVASLNETVEELAGEVAEVKRVVKAARKRRSAAGMD